MTRERNKYSCRIPLGQKQIVIFWLKPLKNIFWIFFCLNTKTCTWSFFEIHRGITNSLYHVALVLLGNFPPGHLLSAVNSVIWLAALSFGQATICPLSKVYLFIYFPSDLGTFSSCFSDHMLVEVNLTQNPDLVPTEMHLNDVNCMATDSNGTFASFKIPLNGCGTIRDGSDPDVLVFSNTVRWSPQQPPGQIQTRIHGFRSRIVCRYARNDTVRLSFKPVQEFSVDQTGMSSCKRPSCNHGLRSPATALLSYRMTWNWRKFETEYQFNKIEKNQKDNNKPLKQGWVKMKKIITDYKRPNWKIQDNLFKMKKQRRNSCGQLYEVVLAYLLRNFPYLF